MKKYFLGIVFCGSFCFGQIRTAPLPVPDVSPLTNAMGILQHKYDYNFRIVADYYKRLKSSLNDFDIDHNTKNKIIKRFDEAIYENLFNGKVNYSNDYTTQRAIKYMEDTMEYILKDEL